MTAYEPVEIDPQDRALLEKIGRLRVLAWSTVIPNAAGRCVCWLDDFELVARHWCIFHDGLPVAAARMSVHQRLEDVPDAEVYEGIFPKPLVAPIASFNRLVVHPQFRGRGLSTRLDDVRMSAARGAGARTTVITLTPEPRDPRVERFQKRGFIPVGGPVQYPASHLLAGVWRQPLICELMPQPPES